ncbi:MAG: hypothetical protein ABIJ21_02345 [Nanoarchaeota archaeon]
MIYLTLFWILTIGFVLIYFLAKTFKKKKVLNYLNDKATLFIIAIGIPLIIVAIATNDPITILGINIPVEMQWVGSLLFAGFGMWKFYLNPMKTDFRKLDREVGELTSKTNMIEKDLRFIKAVLLKKTRT